MTITQDAAGNLHRGAGTPDGGQFERKRNARPGVLRGVAETPATRSREFAAEAIRAYMEPRAAGFTWQGLVPDSDGTPLIIHELPRRGLGPSQADTDISLVAWTAHTGTNLQNETVVAVDRNGDVVHVRSRFANQPGEWISDTGGHMAVEIQHAINLERLRVAGVAIGNTATDDGYSGHKFEGARYQAGVHPKLSELTTLMRADIKRAIEVGALPAEFDGEPAQYRPTVGGGNAIHIHVRGVPDRLQSYELFSEGPEWNRRRQHPAKIAISRVLDVIGAQWQFDDSDGSRDHFHTNYYCFVSFEDGQGAQRRLAEAARKKTTSAA